MYICIVSWASPVSPEYHFAGARFAGVPLGVSPESRFARVTSRPGHVSLEITSPSTVSPESRFAGPRFAGVTFRQGSFRQSSRRAQ